RGCTRLTYSSGKFVEIARGPKWDNIKSGRRKPRGSRTGIERGHFRTVAAASKGIVRPLLIVSTRGSSFFSAWSRYAAASRRWKLSAFKTGLSPGWLTSKSEFSHLLRGINNKPEFVSAQSGTLLS